LALFYEDYEELRPGHQWTSAERLVSEADIAAFATLTGDTHPQHLDPVYAVRSAYGARIAHGFLTASLASGLVYQMGLDEGATHAIVAMSWRFPAAVIAGDVLNVTLTLAARRPSRSRPEFGIIERRYGVSNQLGREVAVGEMTLLCKRRGAPPKP
jgi:3-hydroxybutyryl-CoA dehydratase